jgi:hypothetical protein
MGYRGEDVPDTHGDWGRQTPWQPSSGGTPGNTGAWDGGPHGYAGDENYPPADGGGFGYGPDGGYSGQAQQGYGPGGSYSGQGQQGYGPDGGYTGQPQQGYGPDGGYSGQAQQGYGPQDGQFGGPYGQQPYEQQPHEQYNGYGQGQSGAGGYGGPQGYPQHDDYGYDRGQAPSPGYDQAGYDQRSAPGYAPGGGYQDQGGGYGQAPAYPAPPASGGGYPAPRGGSGGYPALPSGQGGYSAEDAGNDWYGGQPAAANGASFADTGTYRLNGRVIDEYGTGPREAWRDPVRGYPPGPGQPGTGPLPGPANPATSDTQVFTRTGAQDIGDTRQQGRYEDRAGYPEPGYPEYGQDEAAGRPGRGASGGFQGPGGRDAFDSRGGYAAADAYAAPGYGGYDGPSSPSGGPDGDGYNDYEDGFDAGGDPYQDRYGDGTGASATGGGGRAPGGRAALGPLRGKRLLVAALAVIAVGIIGVAAYVFVLKPSSPAGNANTQKALPTGTAVPSQQACVKQLGTYCHISAATDDPVPLTTAELFVPAFTNEKDKTSYQLVSTKVDNKTCGNAVIGSALIKALKAGKCTQALRGSYVSGNNKIMGTIGVINLSTTNEAHYAGRVVGQNDFIAPLTSAKGVASKLGNGTGVVEAEFKGHYLILTWSEFVDGTNPSTKAQDNQLEQFSNDLVSGTANIDLSQRMVTGSAPTPAASS